MTAPRRLILMRHAHAEHEASSDHARRLSARGRRDAHAAGVLLARRGDVPALALVSPAQRTRDTWDALCAGMGQDAEVWFDRSLYDSGPKAVVELLGAVEPEVRSALVIGHNPTMSVLAAALTDGEAAPALEAAVADGLSTASLACFDVPGEWEDLNARRLRLTHLDEPRG